MAAGDSKTGIANQALAMLSEEPIVSLDPPDNLKRARVMAQFYEPSRRAMLAAHPWRCAKRQVQLAAAAQIPAFTYGAAFPAPADFIRFYELPENRTQRWEEMNLSGIGLCVVTDIGSPLDLTYVFDLQDCTQMDPLLVNAIASELAARGAWPISRDMSLKQSCEADRELYLTQARNVSATQASPQLFAGDLLLRARV